MEEINLLQTTYLNPGIVSAESSLCATIHWSSSCVFWFVLHFSTLDLLMFISLYLTPKHLQPFYVLPYYPSWLRQLQLDMLSLVRPKLPFYHSSFYSSLSFAWNLMSFRSKERFPSDRKICRVHSSNAEKSCWAEAPLKIARMTLTIKLDGNWSSFQLANSASPLSVTDSALAPSARIDTQRI